MEWGPVQEFTFFGVKTIQTPGMLKVSLPLVDDDVVSMAAVKTFRAALDIIVTFTKTDFYFATRTLRLWLYALTSTVIFCRSNLSYIPRLKTFATWTFSSPAPTLHLKLAQYFRLFNISSNVWYRQEKNRQRCMERINEEANSLLL